MTQAQQSEAQRLAAICETKGMFPVADELNRMHARILELEQGKCLHQIAEPAAPHAARDLGLAALEQYLKECEENQIVADVGGAFAYAWQRAAAPQAVQAAVPMFWVRLCRDGLYEGPVHNNSTEGKLLRDAKPGEWHPLYLHAAPAHPAEGVPSCVAVGEREAFEQAFITEKLRLMDCGESDSAVHAIRMCHLKLYGDGEYPSLEACFAWFAWQARAAIAATQPAAQGLAHKEPSFYAAFGESGTALPQYSAHTEDGVIYNVLAVARNEGFKGSGLDRLMELGWVVRPVFREAALAAQAKQGGA